MIEMETPGSRFSFLNLTSTIATFPVLLRQNPESYAKFGDEQG
jgi:hypothetical protein